MNPSDNPLSALRDIHLPTAGGWWPPAVGWWIALVCLLALIWLLAFLVLKHRRRSAPRRLAVKRLKQVELNGPLTDAQKVQSLLGITRQYAISQFGRKQVAHLHQADWLEFIEKHERHKHKKNPGNHVDRDTMLALFRLPYVRPQKASQLQSGNPETPSDHPPSHRDLEILRTRLINWCRRVNA